MENTSFEFFDEDINLKDEIIRYISFWPYFLILLFTFLSLSFLYLRYATYNYDSSSVIEIIDEAQDSEMALPTALTVFNRSMINLENEVNILKSHAINSNVVEDLNLNRLFYKVGTIKTSLTTKDLWYTDYELDFNIDTNEISSTLNFSFHVDENKLTIEQYNTSEDLLYSVTFNSLSTLDKNHELPFDLRIFSDSDILSSRKLKVSPVNSQATLLANKLKVTPIGQDSDQLSLSINYQNPTIAESYLNGLMKAFDNDGINDRQSEYERTIKFVDQREKILRKELEVVELRKQNFKQSNNLSELSLDAGNNIDLKYSYNTEIFNSESQITIANYLLESISDKTYDYLPINIGLENFDLNRMIAEHNQIVTQRNKYLSEAGENNYLVKSLQSQLDDLIKNISSSLENFNNSTLIKIENLKKKESEFDNVYNRVPENEKTLRSIERELSIKEALYLLLLQKREEAAINLAVVRPSIKIIDYPRTNLGSKSPKPFNVYIFAIVLSSIIYFGFLYVWFFMDNKIHRKEDLAKRLNKNIPIICEIPFIDDKSQMTFESLNNESSRSILAESVRMLISNLKYLDLAKSDQCKSMVFTSSIKGEGKTLTSVSTAVNISSDTEKKVLLVGADLRNPQIHKIFGVEKNMAGLSDILYKNEIDQYKNYINKFGNLDVIFSGSIPPNPNALLASDNFKNLIEIFKENYDYLLIDSAPCLLVSDSFQIMPNIDSVIYMFRANFSELNIIEYINEQYKNGRFKNLNLVFNAVGKSQSYGYKYGYQYGYKYGYKYGYNYGYGYGYSSDSE